MTKGVKGHAFGYSWLQIEFMVIDAGFSGDWVRIEVISKGR